MGVRKSPRAKALGDSVLPIHGVDEKNVVLIGTDDLIEIIPGTHISSIAIGSSAEIDPCALSDSVANPLEFGINEILASNAKTSFDSR